MKQILNVGCGNSDYGTHFVDLYPTRKEIIKCDVSKEKLVFEDNKFDEVYSSFVFEHLNNPNFTLKEIYRVLKKSGKVEIHTNNAGWLFYHNSKSKVKTHYGGYEKDKGGFNRFSKETEDKHYALYTFHNMKNHFQDVGFKEIKTELYRRDKLSLRIRFVEWCLEHSRFNWASYPQIKIVGIK